MWPIVEGASFTVRCHYLFLFWAQDLPTKKNQGNGGHLSDLDLAWNQLDAGGHEAAYALAHVLQISESRLQRVAAPVAWVAAGKKQ